ncbi:MAG: 4Fe-4S dicluster domain-containing protein [Armatimonadetes bacterium]|nr:4Fe-4S dicluster domain-containing protein [Armatimonadota bacterium]NIM23730.1 4Fe-4S dicluster domain-containing protein [Armatimonadota bacterium]NIM67607.1 4Fe-4S dicluster domain-containing protein [Armatimonadota bacterium]NIM76130.1 4Fe-4S dicluster domain-containing protein [Armatimonadota bacterium]NIN05813.1 4Fe-4S dicluster domain-containing protein [Armatimonadota bacterium]
MQSEKSSTDKKDLTQARAEELKAGGFIPQRQKGKITLRCKAPGGRLTSERLEKIAAVASKYGRGIVHLSVRQSPEILYVDLADLDAVVRELGEVGQEIASCGKRFRVATACGGCEYNPNGWTETQRLSLEATARFFGQDTPHKFKTCFSGCVRDCMKSIMMDLGFQGMVEPKLLHENCTHCTLCVKACEDDALHMGEEDLPVRDLDKCISCGDCIKVCPFDAMVPKRIGHAIHVGGKHGKHPHTAYPVAEFVPDEQVMDVIEKTMTWYREHGEKGERIGNTLDRVGIDSYRRTLRAVVGDGLLNAAELKKPKWRNIFYRGLVETFPVYGDL